MKKKSSNKNNIKTDISNKKNSKKVSLKERVKEVKENPKQSAKSLLLKVKEVLLENKLFVFFVLINVLNGLLLRMLTIGTNNIFALDALLLDHLDICFMKKEDSYIF